MADGVLAVLALAGAFCLPAVLTLVFCADELTDRVVCRFAEWREHRRERRLIRRLNREIGTELRSQGLDLTEFDRDDRRTIEQLAADLRQLSARRRPTGGRSVVWDDNLLQAYDDRLRKAASCLGVTEYLAELEGIDREIERVRVEGELQAAGLILPAATARHHRPRRHQR